MIIHYTTPDKKSIINHFSIRPLSVQLHNFAWKNIVSTLEPVYSTLRGEKILLIVGWIALTAEYEGLDYWHFVLNESVGDTGIQIEQSCSCLEWSADKSVCLIFWKYHICHEYYYLITNSSFKYLTKRRKYGMSQQSKLNAKGNHYRSDVMWH